MSDVMGKVHRLYRYPVKSFQGESLTELKIVESGVWGDRSHVLLDESRGGAHLSAKQVPGLLGYRAVFAEQGEADSEETFPAVRITAPDGRGFRWDESFHAYMEKAARRRLKLHRHVPDDRLLAVDDQPVLVATTGMLAKLSRMAGNPLDIRRFRPNLWIETPADAADDEASWTGHRLRVGHAVLEFVGSCERCSMITVDPDTLRMDATLLRTVVDKLAGCFGMYARVLQPGTVRIGDTAEWNA